MDFLNILFDRKDLVEKALEIDNNIMKENLSSETFYDNLEKITVLGINKYSKLLNQENILIIYDGNPFQTIKILCSLNKGNHILFPNHSYLGINSLICKAYNMINNNIYLDTSINYNRYIATQEVFSTVYIVGEKQEFIEIKNDFKDAKHIELDNNL